MKRLNINPGDISGKLMFVGYIGSNKWKHLTCLCICDCGGQWAGVANNFRKGHTKSCGCLQREKAAETGRNNKGIHKFGKNASNYIDGRTPENHLIRISSKMKEWSRNILKRDNYICQMCGKRGYKLVAHHIYPFSMYEWLRFELWNGITFCEKCHKSIKGKELEVAKSFIDGINF